MTGFLLPLRVSRAEATFSDLRRRLSQVGRTLERGAVCRQTVLAASGPAAASPVAKASQHGYT